MKTQSICMTKDRGTAGTVSLACLGTKSGVFPALFTCSIYSVGVLATPSSQEIPPPMPDTLGAFWKCTICRGIPARGTAIRWGLYHSCPTAGTCRSQTIVGVPLHYLLILHPILITQNQNVSVCLDAFAISFRTAWKDSVQFIPTGLAQICITSKNKHRIQHLLLLVP